MEAAPQIQRAGDRVNTERGGAPPVPDTARLMLANSEFLILLNQSATDRDELAGLLHISENQLSYITNVAAGCGLIRCAGNIVPFENSFPRSTRLYQLMTTKPDEALRGV